MLKSDLMRVFIHLEHEKFHRLVFIFRVVEFLLSHEFADAIFAIAAIEDVLVSESVRKEFAEELCQSIARIVT